MSPTFHSMMEKQQVLKNQAVVILFLEIKAELLRALSQRNSAKASTWEPRRQRSFKHITSVK